MAQLLINTKTHRIVTVQPDSHKWGRMESKQVWLMSGGLEQDWKDDFFVVKVPGKPFTALDIVGKQFNIEFLDSTVNGEVAVQPWQLDILVS